MKTGFILLFLLSCLALPAQTIRLKSTEGYIPTSDSVKLHFQTLGEGPDTILVVHGGPGFGANYLAADLMPLAAHHLLLFYDQAGAGYSTSVQDTARLNINRFVQDLETVRRYFKIKKINLLGHSWGGFLSGYYATVYPDNIKSLALIGPLTPAAKWMGQYNSDSKLDSLSYVIEQNNKKRFRNAPADSTKACWDFYALWARGHFATPAEARRAWGDLCQCRTANLLSPLRYYVFQSMGAWDITNKLAKVKARALVLVGDQDEMPFASFEAWHKSLPNSTFFPISGAGHLPYVDYPEATFAALESFYQGKTPAEAALHSAGAGVVLPSDARGPAYARTRATLIGIENDLVQRINRGAWDSVALIYHKHASIYAPGAPPVSGRPGIASFWHTLSLRGMHHLSLQLMDFEQSGSQITARGKYVMYNAQNALLDTGKFIAIYKIEGKRWQVQTDMFNSSLEMRSPLEEPDYLAWPRE